MNQPPDHWFLDLMPLAALLLVSAFMYAFRQRRDSRVGAGLRARASRPGRNTFSVVSREEGDFGGDALTQPLHISSPALFDGSHGSDGKEAWNTLQARLVALAEQDEHGGADIRELHRLVAEYDGRRSNSHYRGG